MGFVTSENVHDVVSYHAPDQDGLDKIAKIREGTEAFINCILANAPSCADTSSAIRHARNAMMESNAAIVLKGAV